MPPTKDPMMTTAITKPAVHETDEHTLPPFLRRVRIRGFKSIRFCDVRLQPMTSLVGRNAAGKSNFLDALAFLRDTMEAGVAEAVKRRNNWSSAICRTSNTPKMEIEVETVFTCGPPWQMIKNKKGPCCQGKRKPDHYLTSRAGGSRPSIALKSPWGHIRLRQSAEKGWRFTTTTQNS